MNLRHLFAAVGIAMCMVAATASATVHRVFPGQSIQASINGAKPGDTILVEPGVYRETGNGRYGLRISTPDLRLIGKVDEAGGKVRLVKTGDQITGVYAAPAACGPDVGVGECPDQLQGFYIRGFSVEDFPRHGIQTRFVDGFTIQGNASVRNLENGIYPTISANGLVQENVSYGSLDTAMWVAASECGFWPSETRAARPARVSVRQIAVSGTETGKRPFRRIPAGYEEWGARK